MLTKLVKIMKSNWVIIFLAICLIIKTIFICIKTLSICIFFFRFIWPQGPFRLITINYPAFSIRCQKSSNTIYLRIALTSLFTTTFPKAFSTLGSIPKLFVAVGFNFSIMPCRHSLFFSMISIIYSEIFL